MFPIMLVSSIVSYPIPTQLNNSETVFVVHPMISASLGTPKFLCAFFPLVPFAALSSASLSSDSNR